MKKLLAILAVAALVLISIPLATRAAPVSWDGDFANQILKPLQTFWGANIQGSHFTATSTSATSTFPILSSNTFCLAGDCKTAWDAFPTAANTFIVGTGSGHTIRELEGPDVGASNTGGTKIIGWTPSGGSGIWVNYPLSSGVTNSSLLLRTPTGTAKASDAVESDDLVTLGQFPSLSPWTIAGNDIYNSNTGNVGIGTSTPGSKLYVVGTTTTSVLSIPGTTDGCATFASGILGSTGTACGSGSGGINSLNGQTGSSQTFATSTATSTWGINSSSNVHTFTLPSNVGFFSNDVGYLTSVPGLQEVLDTGNSANNQSISLLDTGTGDLSEMNTFGFSVNDGAGLQTFQSSSSFNIRQSLNENVIVSDTINANRTQTLQNRSGVLAHLDQIPATSTILGLFSATSPLAYNSGTGVFSMPAASSTQSGYLTSTDWSTFNNKQTAGNYITALTGDITASGPGSVSATLATVNANVGTFGSASVVPTFAVNSKGLITSVSTSTVVAPAGTLTGTTLASNVVSSSLTSVSSSLTGVLKATSGALSTGLVNLASEITGTLGIANGGTGATTTIAALNSLLPTQTGNSGKVLQTDGTNASWEDAAGGSPGGTDGMVQFNDGGVFGGVVDFFWDNVDKKLGIGTNIPAAKLHVGGTYTTATTTYSTPGAFTYNLPAGTEYLEVFIWGGGGAGGGAAYNGGVRGASGGGAGAFVHSYVYPTGSSVSGIVASGANGNTGGTGYAAGGNGSTSGGGGGGSTEFGGIIACGGGGGGLGDSTPNTSGGGGGTNSGGNGSTSDASGAGGGGGCATAGTSASGNTPGIGGTGGSSPSGVSGSGARSTSSGNYGAGGSSAGISGDGGTPTDNSGSGALGSGGAAAGVDGSGQDSGGGGNGAPAGTSAGDGTNGGSPGAGGGASNQSASGKGANGGNGKVIVVAYINPPTINVADTFFANTIAAFVGSAPSTPAAFSVIPKAVMNFFVIGGTIAGNTYDSIFLVDSAGHLYTQGPVPTVSNCGSGGPVAVGNDNAGTIDVLNTTSACTITFASEWSSPPVCVFTLYGTNTALNATSVTTKQAIIASASNMGSRKIAYQCMGIK